MDDVARPAGCEQGREGVALAAELVDAPAELRRRRRREGRGLVAELALADEDHGAVDGVAAQRSGALRSRARRREGQRPLAERQERDDAP